MKTEAHLHLLSTVSFIPYALFKSALLWTSSTEGFKVFLCQLFVFFFCLFLLLLLLHRKDTDLCVKARG